VDRFVENPAVESGHGSASPLSAKALGSAGNLEKPVETYPERFSVDRDSTGA
jgi:hypothetical protein